MEGLICKHRPHFLLTKTVIVHALNTVYDLLTLENSTNVFYSFLCKENLRLNDRDLLIS